MSSTKYLSSVIPAALLVAGISTSNAAFAADLLMDPPVVEAPEVHTQPAGGWYLRGDIGYQTHSMDGPMYSVAGEGVGTVLTMGEGGSVDLDDGYSAGIGVGYQINENFRVDATLSYDFDRDFRATTLGFSDAIAAASPDTPNTTGIDTTTYSAYTVMANAYVDLGNFNGFTPYVGAGIGGAYVTYDSLSNQLTCVQQTVDCPNGAASGWTGDAASSTRTDIHNGTESWRFAWALHAGTSYDLTEKAKLDLGYSYNRIEGGDMFEWLDGSGTQGLDKGIDTHTFRAGIRYQIW